MGVRGEHNTAKENENKKKQAELFTLEDTICFRVYPCYVVKGSLTTCHLLLDSYNNPGSRVLGAASFSFFFFFSQIAEPPLNQEPNMMGEEMPSSNKIFGLQELCSFCSKQSSPFFML